MKQDLDKIMQARHIDVLLITGPAQQNPAMHYLTGNVHVTHADLVKKRGSEAVLFHGSMEREEAAKSGLKTKGFEDYPLPDLLKQANGDAILARALRYQAMFKDLDIQGGNVALFGKIDAGVAVGVFDRLQELMPELCFSGELDNSVILEAMFTKDDEEIQHIRRMGEITVEIVGKVAEFLSSHQAKDEILVKADGQPLTIGDVKSRINLWVAEHGAENPEGAVFAIGRDAAIPHSSGTVSDPLRLGQTIVFDFFPCEEGGGYFYDFTRTWCLGYAPEEAHALYEDVLNVYSQVSRSLKAGEHCPIYQKMACDLFEAKGHPTIQSDYRTEQGYVHSLGHGVGLNIHERPWFGSNSSQADRLAPGAVFTVEPGLYYPERGMGVRLEDTYTVHENGCIKPLVEYPMELVLPVKR